MKIAVAIGIAALCLIGALLLMRREPPPAALPRSASPANPAAAGPAEPAPGAAKRTAPSLPAVADPRRHAADLARALRDGDEKAVRAIQKALHDLLHPPVADDDNGAIPYQKAFDLARERLGGMSMQGLDRVCYTAALTGKEMTAAQRAALRDWFEKNGPAAAEVTALLREGGQKPRCAFPQQDQKLGMNLGYAINFLQLAAQVQQEDGKAGDAADTARAGLAMAGATRSSPDLFSQMLGCAQQLLTLEGVQRSLDPSSPKLAAALEATDPAAVREAYQRSLLGDLDSTVSSFLKWKEDPAAAPDEETRRWARGPLAMQEVASYVEGIADFLRFAGRPYHEMQGDMEALVRQHGEFAPWYASLSQRTIRSLPSLTRAIAKSEAKMSMAKAALELERFRAQHGGYPASLDALNSPPPRDPFTGQPFAYRKEGGGFVLESPGPGSPKDAVTWRRP